jgi:hypothetical protein
MPRGDWMSEVWCLKGIWPDGTFKTEYWLESRQIQNGLFISIGAIKEECSKIKVDAMGAAYTSAARNERSYFNRMRNGTR